MTQIVLKKSIYLRATLTQVWSYLTEPDRLATWFHKSTTPLTGGPYEMFGAKSGEKVIWGDVLVSEPFARLHYTFIVGPMGDHVSTVKWTLTKVDGGTKLELEHEDLPRGEAAFDLTLALDKGWDEHLARLRAEAMPD